MSKITYIGGDYIENVGGSIKVYAKEGYEIHSNKKIIFSGKEGGISFGEPEDAPKQGNSNVVKVEFLDENNKVLIQETLAEFGNIQATNFMIGKPVKIKITTKNVADYTQITFSLKGDSKSPNQQFFGIDKQKWNLKVTNNTCETDLFEFDNLWFSEDLENYNYTSYNTEISTDDINSFCVKGDLNSQPFELPDKAERLKPVTYLRNYEELIGLFHTNDSGVKDMADNYENKFILKSQLEKISVSFSEFINHEKKPTLAKIKTRVEQDAKLLWDTGVKQVQSGNLDDRPLYWTRLKMQVRLKQHYLFENDIDFKTSIVKKGTELEKIIQLFEEKSRNYDGIDFSKAGSKKKVLITGFDPFILNQFDNKSIKLYSPNIKQSNPSGCVALKLKDINISNSLIQTMIVPVRYCDFDGSQNKANGQGEGIIEKYIKLWISKVDMIITISQSGPGDYNIDKFATNTRGGFNDNQDSIRISGSKALNTTDEWIETTLPKEFTNAPFVKYNWDFNRVSNVNKIKPIIGQKLSQGSGDDYLSNEIFYRVAKMRKDIKPSLPTGHFHISKIQGKGEDLNSIKINDLINIVKKGIEEGIKGI